MITKETVLILGAGASMPYGFPSGQGLVDLICEVPPDIRKVLEEIAKEIRIVTHFIEDLKRAEPDSIDDFLEHRPEFQEVGKAAIALTLLPLEREHNLIAKWRNDRLGKRKPELGGHWYKYLSSLLRSSFEDFGKNKLSIITFNYERSLEHYLLTTLQSFHKKSDEECAEKLNGIKIIHIYGQLGFLSWQIPNGEKIEFGAWGKTDEREKRIITSYAMRSIKTMSEGFEEKDPDITYARQLMAKAKSIFFLGFGFHPRNLEILGIKSLPADKNVRASSLNLSIQRKLEIHKLGISSLKWGREKSGPAGLDDKDIYEYLYSHAVID
jgi:hypothetical protein